MAKTKIAISSVLVLVLINVVVSQPGWNPAHATFYGDMTGPETMEGACGYGDPNREGYGLSTAALSTALFNNGFTCGACFEIQCVDDPKWCKPGTITITATNFCPPADTGKPDAWCNPPRKHVDLSMPMFVKLAEYKPGIIPVSYRRVPCIKTGGMKFEVKRNPYFIMVLVYNVVGAGDIKDVKIKGTNTNWIQMQHNWGQNWDTNVRELVGQALSFQVTTSDGKTVVSDNVAPADWKFGSTYEGKNF